MPVELRKRKPVAPPAPAPAPKKKATGKAKKAEKPAEKAKKEDTKKAPKEEKAKKAPAEPKEEKAAKQEDKQDKQDKKPAVGDTIALDGFGGDVQTNDGETTTLKKLVDESKAGVVLFTYPKASTPGCTNQACLFRDSYEPLTADGLAIYGLSSDSPKANSAFKEKQKLPYALLCDPSATLIAAIGFKKQPRGTQRGVFVVDKDGRVLVAEAGSPAGTVERVKALVEEMKGK